MLFERPVESQMITGANKGEKRGRSGSKGQKCTDREPEGGAGHATLKASEEPVSSGAVLGDQRGKGNGYRPCSHPDHVTRRFLFLLLGMVGEVDQEVP